MIVKFKTRRQRSRSRPDSVKRKRPGKKFYLLSTLALLLAILTATAVPHAIALHAARRGPVDAILVLGGSIRRELYVAELAKTQPQIPILISSGSKNPCIWLIFERSQAPTERVWLENCASSTFGNFYFSCPILEQWNVRKVKVITSPSHLPRAKWLAQIILGAKGIAVEVELVSETGVPGNQEFWLKTILDVTRSLGWAAIAQFHSPPPCAHLTHLSEVDMDRWYEVGFECEHQANLDENPAL